MLGRLIVLAWCVLPNRTLVSTTFFTMVQSPPPRRSIRLSRLRLRGVSSSTGNTEAEAKPKTKPKPKRKQSPIIANKKESKTSKNSKKVPLVPPISEHCLPRTREIDILAQDDSTDGPIWVIGIDEAGRGPLAGPVVAAAAYVPRNIPGVVDSKKITKEEKREELYEEIVSSPNVLWAVAIVDAERIDNINILQATLEGMQMAATAVMHPPIENNGDHVDSKQLEGASAARDGCYVVWGGTNDKGESIKLTDHSSCTNTALSEKISSLPSSWYALVDGNRLPKEMPCESESMVKGDSREYAIAAASILAKVTRDRLMREYDRLYPEYLLAKHKGYPTAAHMALVKKHGASPIHRRTFAPLKHMTFDKNGRIV